MEKMHTTRRLPVILIAGLLVLTMVQVVESDSIANHVVIGEILPDPTGGDEGQEWVELYNPTGEAKDISGWTGSSTSYSDQFTIPDGTSIAPYGFYLIGESGVPKRDLEANLHITNDGQNANFNITDKLETEIDLVGWDISTAYETSPCPKPATGKSLQRKVDSTTDYDGVHGPGWDTDNNSADFFTGSPDPKGSSDGPVPPVPELSTLILFSIGLIVLVGYALLTKRRK